MRFNNIYVCKLGDLIGVSYEISVQAQKLIWSCLAKLDFSRWDIKGDNFVNIWVFSVNGLDGFDIVLVFDAIWYKNYSPFSNHTHWCVENEWSSVIWWAVYFSLWNVSGLLLCCCLSVVVKLMFSPLAKQILFQRHLLSDIRCGKSVQIISMTLSSFFVIEFFIWLNIINVNLSLIYHMFSLGFTILTYVCWQLSLLS